MEHKEYTIKVTQSQKQFLEYCEKVQYGEIKRLIIKDGNPKSAEISLKSIRFDIKE